MRAVCEIDDIPLGEGRAVTIDGRRVAIFHTDAGWFAIDQACPHAGGPLADGIASDCSVICPLHERRYSLEDGSPVEHDGASVAVHAIEIRGRSVWVDAAATLTVAV